MNSDTLKKYKKALNELKAPLNEVFSKLDDIGCRIIPQPISNNKVKMIIFDKGIEVKKQPIYSQDQFKVKQIEFFNFFYNKYF